MTALAQLAAQLAQRELVPYLGPGVLALDAVAVPASSAALVAELGRRVALPARLRGNLPAAAQYVENFKHRKTLDAAMAAAFAAAVGPNALHRALAAAAPPLIVSAWYDDALLNAFAGSSGWGLVRGVSQASPAAAVADPWVAYRRADGSPCAAAEAEGWGTVVYQPFGGVRPDPDFIVSDSDFVEVLTEIDIQTPIPPVVQRLRTGRSFLFVGCRFDEQTTRSYARQIAKRSADRHLAVISGTLTRNEARFLAELQIERIDLPLEAFATALAAAVQATPAGSAAPH